MTRRALAALVGFGALAVVVGFFAVTGRAGAQEVSGDSALRTFAGAQLRAACGLLEGVGGSCSDELGGAIVTRDVGNRVLAGGYTDATPQFSKAIVTEFLETGDVADIAQALHHLAVTRPAMATAMSGFDVGPDLKCELDGDVIVCTYSIRDYRGVRGINTLRIPVAVFAEEIPEAVVWVEDAATSTPSR